MKNADTAVDYVIYLDSFALSLKVEGLRPHTISCYLRDVRRLGECSARAAEFISSCSQQVKELSVQVTAHTAQAKLLNRDPDK